jgi:hypothetical protein
MHGNAIDALAQHPFQYTLYGLTLACSAPLEAAGLCRTAGGEVDVLIDWAGSTADARQAAVPPGPGSRLLVEATGGWVAVSDVAQREGDWTCLRFGYDAHHIQFAIAPGGARVVVTWTPAVLPYHACTLLLSAVMNYLLHVQGRMALHASVVAWRDVAFGFAGVQGTGKSTTVSALLQRGCASVSDDVAALTRQRGGWAVFPGLASVRLSSQVQAVLGIPAAAAAPLWQRSSHRAEQAFQSMADSYVVSFAETQAALPAGTPLPLAGVFLLPPRADALASPCITALPAADAVPGLAEHLLTPAWLKPPIDQERFMTLVDLARQIPVRMVARPNTLTALPQLCDAVLGEMERLWNAWQRRP